MDHSIDQLMGLVDDILTFSQVETGELIFEVEEVSPRDVVRSVSEPLGRKAAAKGLEFEVDVAPEVPRRLYTDPARLSQVLFHLGGNAVKFTERGKVRIQVTLAAPGVLVAREDTAETPERTPEHTAGAQAETAAGTALEISVRDTGPGMDDTTLARLFRPFTQGDTSSTRRHGGTGLGLVLSQRLVKRAGGRIDVSSTAGRGSMFRVIWPCSGVASSRQGARSAADAETADTPEPEDPGGAHGRGAGSGDGTEPRRVLVVEDDEISRLVLTSELEERGLAVIAAQNGEIALDQLGRRGFDLVLMDCQMPVMDGYRATRILRRREAGRRHTPVVAATAHAMEGDREKCLAAGMDDYLAKPYSEAELEEKLAAWLPPVDPPASGDSGSR
ncbi:MAG: response regulator, partial [Holophagales bacterium]|nr:response regulator [Holophagales bacterium]